MKPGASLFQRRLTTEMSKILLIAISFILYSLSREVMADTATEEKSNNKIVDGERFPVSSACILQT